MTRSAPRWLEIAHHLPERTRLRSPALRRDVPACERVANALARVRGIVRVAVRPYTGSVLVEHAATLELTTLVEATCRAFDCTRVLAIGEAPPMDESAEVAPFASIAHQLVDVVREIDRDIRRKSEGSIDLGILATLGFFGAGAAEVVATRKLQMPPWFNLAWWGYRTFMTTHEPELHHNGIQP
jgi:hypothetical protein